MDCRTGSTAGASCVNPSLYARKALHAFACTKFRAKSNSSLCAFCCCCCCGFAGATVLFLSACCCCCGSAGAAALFFPVFCCCCCCFYFLGSAFTLASLFVASTACSAGGSKGISSTQLQAACVWWMLLSCVLCQSVSLTSYLATLFDLIHFFTYVPLLTFRRRNCTSKAEQDPALFEMKMGDGRFLRVDQCSAALAKSQTQLCT